MISKEYKSCKNVGFKSIVIMVVFNLIHLAMGVDVGEIQKIDPNKISDELAMLSAATKTNYEKIKTLQGEVSFESMIIYRGTYAADLVKRHAGITIKEPNELAQRTEGTTEFKIDLKKNLFFKQMNRPKPIEYIDLDKGIAYTSSEKSFERMGIINSKYTIESYPYTRNKDRAILTSTAHKRLRQNPEIITDNSDARIGFNIGRPVWELLTQFSDGLRRYNKGDVDTFYNVVLEKEQTAKGIIYRMHLANPRESQPFEKFILDGEKGFNPTYIEIKNDKGITISEITTDFIEIQGIFLPSKRYVLQYDGNDGRLRRSSNTTFNYAQVNTTLPENTFSLSNLGLKNDDRFIDEIEGKEYKYKDASLIFVADVNK